ncbi:MAG TPA: hypothetical protein VM933_09545, partial [Acidimicrobiales bacterium]|nr:hypothetical protein [Acidimicrobiales bacterium]
MPAVPLHVRGGPADVLAEGFDAIRAELGVVEGFANEVLAEVDEVVRRGPWPSTPASADLLDVPFLT